MGLVTLHEGGISEPYSKDRLNEFVAGEQCYCLTFTSAPLPALEDITKAAETHAISNETVGTAPQPQQAVEVNTPADVKVAAVAEDANTNGTEAPALIDAAVKYVDSNTSVVVEQAVTVTAPVESESNGMCGFGCCG